MDGPDVLCVSPGLYIDIMVLEHPGDPYWLEKQREYHVHWMKMMMRAHAWPFSAGPRGRLP